MQLFIGLLIPFLGTTLGAGMVFLMKNKINSKIEKLLLGFAAGVMVAASVFKLKKSTMMVLAVTLHNIPEGMAVGVTFAGALIGNAGITMAGAFALSIRNSNSKFSRRSYYFYAFKK